MGIRPFDNKRKSFYLLLPVVFSLSIGCNSTQHLTANQFLVYKNTIEISADRKVRNKGEMKDNLTHSIIQKPNSNSVDILPFNTQLKLWRYNRHYDKFHDRPDSLLPKSVERPVIYDSSLASRTAQNMKAYLYSLGYFYAIVKDTCTIKRRKAHIDYDIDLGINYKINTVTYNVDDSNIARIVNSAAKESALRKGKPFSYSLIDDERSRLASIIRDSGYYRFTQENINFIYGLDTVNKKEFKDVESPFENAVNFVSNTEAAKDHIINITGTIQLAEDTEAYHKFTVANIHVYPDYANADDLADSGMTKKTIDSIDFFYHDEYVHPRVMYQHIYLNPGTLYSQDDDDKTRTNLNNLGIFQYLKVEFNENPFNKYLLDCNILLSRAKKHDFTVNYQVSNGSTYLLGNSLSLNYRIKNFAKGANLLTIGVNGGVELGNNPGSNFIKDFFVLTEYYGVDASIDFPKFIAPVSESWFGNSNVPHTIVEVGDNVMDRLDYFRLINTSGSLAYSWRQTSTITWKFSPVFVNIIRLPVETDSFKNALDSNEYLKNSYLQTFIEGENLSFTYDNTQKKHGENYSFLKLSIEEAGGILGGLNQLGGILNNEEYSQYTKFDFDARHYFTLPKSVFAFRFDGGVGIPYGNSSALPYIKQYFTGGPYSLRGWRIRTLGPGSTHDSSSNPNQIDRTGDIKLELNGEYRFPVAPLFAGAVKMNGAIFADAGNIWLARKDAGYPGGDFEWNTLGQDIAVDMGLGLRFDIESFLTLRFDLGMPVKEPYVGANNGWVFNAINPYDPDWRYNNLILNVSIGYPF